MLAIDTEVTGLDLHHGARPFLVTICRDGEDPYYWEALVDPLTRRPCWKESELHEIRQVIYEADWLVGQNIKFDYEALLLLFRDYWLSFEPPWEKTYDTLIAGHLLASNMPHDLTSMTIQYLGEDISEYEEKLHAVVNRVLRRVRKEFPDWCLAAKENPLTPSAKTSSWGHDMWLPRAYAVEKRLTPDHPEYSWHTICSDYANVDSITTFYLWLEMEKHMRRRGLWKIFLERMKLPPIAMDMEIPVWNGNIRGVSVNGFRLNGMIDRFERESKRQASICEVIAETYHYDLVLPKTGANKSLKEFCFDYLKLPVLKGQTINKDKYPSLTKDILEEYEITTSPQSRPHAFVKALRRKRKRDTSVVYMKGYKRYWKSVGGEHEGYYCLHPNCNITATDTLRWSFTNPNTSCVSKQEDFNLREGFGPLPGRQWYSMDGQNLELRIPAYVAGEEDMIWIFEHPNDPPYYGSYHLLVFDLLHPKEFKEYGKKSKQKFESTLYQWVKNGNFAVLYGAQEAKADTTYHVAGAYQKIRRRFPKIAALADRQIKLANQYGYVTTIPDRDVDPENGYPILCSRTECGYISPTVPLNYFIQSSAMWWTAISMVSCHNRIKEWQQNGFDIYMNLQVHDELVFDTVTIDADNLWRIAELRSLMEACGERIGVPTPVSVERHDNSWAEGEDITQQLLSLVVK